MVKKIAIANPQHAPYGRRAEEALKHYKVYEKVKSKLVYRRKYLSNCSICDNGSSRCRHHCIVACAFADDEKLGGHYYVIPENSHKPLEQGFVILKKANKILSPSPLRIS